MTASSRKGRGKVAEAFAQAACATIASSAMAKVIEEASP
jgi:hypothetical protein